MLLPRQQESPALYGSTAAPSATSTSSSSSSDSNGNSTNATNALWKYAIVVILAILALSTVFRLVFLRRARRLHRLQQEQLFSSRNRGSNGYRTRAGGADDRRRFSTDTVDLQERGYSGEPLATEPPPPAYDETSRGGATNPNSENPPFPPVPLAVPPPTIEGRPSFLSRFSSRFKRSPSSISTPSTAVEPAPSSSAQSPNPNPNEDYFALSMRQATSPETTARILAEENQSNRWRGDVAIRRALSDAGILVGRNRAASRASATSAAAETAQREREERRRVRRERRRERRRRERERNEGLGLPVYSKKKAEGEEVLQVAEGVKEDDTDSEEEEDGSASEGDNAEASTSSAAQDPVPAATALSTLAPAIPPSTEEASNETRPHPLA